MDSLVFVEVTSDAEIANCAFNHSKNFKEIRYNSPEITKIYLTYYVSNYTANLIKVSDKITAYPVSKSCKECKVKFMNISCDVKEMNTGNKEFIRIGQFTYSGKTEITGNMSDPSNIDCLILNKDYKGKLFGQSVSKYSKCGSFPLSAIIGIAAAGMVVVGIIITVIVICIMRKRRTKGFSEIPNSI
ncbi:hypothetical protein TVAG_210980 [Trichomonas vaginalis G3]|uniref:Uncharacterized protein n=1 Tax=Trichomonas vaginalis (strain ATCC PRA-98 / G3) TaxID=412133 RepID=A2F883_TRIV3|nr:structural constituent of cell wall [Trichomonas vaginalis G3]EAX98903.1 hypothetical protein TVAG_210980 [Trichomonas vaginalis G3]KAI5511640.1 structural constituent of cell wall [Trichomonas vaginalis G3]|eukprot:XP_001311833.1 hypothetical protein [Trichomonas vaginalis G3]